MGILLLSSACNSLSQHAYVDFTSHGHCVGIATATKANGMRSAVGYPRAGASLSRVRYLTQWLDHSLIRSSSRR